MIQTKLTPSTSIAATLVACSLFACSANPLLVGGNPGAAGTTGSSGSTGSPGTAGTGGGTQPTTGTAGTIGATAGTGGGTQPTTGAAGTIGATAGTGGGLGSAGTGAKPLAISGKEALGRLASLLWQAPPDGAVLARATQAQTVADLDLIVREMLRDPRATAGVRAFYRHWLGLDVIQLLAKDTTLFPAYTPELQADLENETETFGAEVTLAMNGTFDTLLRAPFSFINGRLADLYGVAGVTGDGLRKVMLDGQHRAGLLTQPGLQVLSSLVARNSPTRRGVYVSERFLCRQAPVPPAGIDQTLPIGPGVSVRSALATNVAQSASCTACHALIDPIGLEFETFDAIGRTRTADNGVPVDISGLKIIEPNGGVTSPVGPVATAAYVATSNDARTCFARQWLAYATSTSADHVDEKMIAPVFAAFRDSGFSLQELIVATLTSDAFLAH